MAKFDTKMFEKFWETVVGRGITDAGILPCDRLQGVIAHFPNRLARYDLTREEEGVGILAGAYLAGARPLLLVQSSGLGNSLNALMSLNKTYGIPLPIVASWRGARDERVEAQKPLGSHIEGVLQSADIFHITIERPEEIERVSDLIDSSYQTSEPAVALVSPTVWPEWSARFSPTAWPEEPCQVRPVKPPREGITDGPRGDRLTRYQAIETIADAAEGDTVLVSNIGYPSRELYAIRDRPLNFYMTGSFGLASSIGLGIAEHVQEKVWVIDGDGSLLANPNALIQVSARRPNNLIVFCLDNRVHGSTGGQPSLSRYIDLSQLAAALDLSVFECSDDATFKASLEKVSFPGFVHYHILPGNAEVPVIPLRNKEIRIRFMNGLLQTPKPK